VGAFFTNIQVRSGEADDVEQALRPLLKAKAYLSKSENGWVSVFPEQTETQDESLQRMTQSLSAMLKTDAVGIMCHDSDVFLYWLGREGNIVDEYNSLPNYFDDSMPEEPTGGEAALLEPLLAAGVTRDQVFEVLHKSEYVFAEEGIGKFAELLGIPNERSTVGYNYAQDGGEASGLKLI
jgi:hypothetical protein